MCVLLHPFSHFFTVFEVHIFFHPTPNTQRPTFNIQHPTPTPIDIILLSGNMMAQPINPRLAVPVTATLRQRMTGWIFLWGRDEYCGVCYYNCTPDCSRCHSVNCGYGYYKFCELLRLWLKPMPIAMTTASAVAFDCCGFRLLVQWLRLWLLQFGVAP